MSKWCFKCKTIKNDCEFSVNRARKDGLQTLCKECRKAFDKKRYLEKGNDEKRRVAKKLLAARLRNRKIAIDYLKLHPCVDCGEKDILVLEFDHVRGVKVKDVSRMVTGAYSVEKLKKEIDKCDVRCANCHRRKTSKGSWWKKKLN